MNVKWMFAWYIQLVGVAGSRFLIVHTAIAYCRMTSLLNAVAGSRSQTPLRTRGPADHHLTQRWLSDPSTNAYRRWAVLGASSTVTIASLALAVLPGGAPSSVRSQLAPSHHLTQRWLSDPSTNAYGRWAALGVSMTVTTPTPALTVLPGGVPSSAICELHTSDHQTRGRLVDRSMNDKLSRTPLRANMTEM